jgi:hypothetical protein
LAGSTRATDNDNLKEKPADPTAPRPSPNSSKDRDRHFKMSRSMRSRSWKENGAEAKTTNEKAKLGQKKDKRRKQRTRMSKLLCSFLRDGRKGKSTVFERAIRDAELIRKS